MSESRRDPELEQFSDVNETSEPAEIKAWELVDPEIGRYMPRRIRGSCRGRALG